MSGLTEAGIERFRAIARSYVNNRTVPGMVTGLASGPEDVPSLVELG